MFYFFDLRLSRKDKPPSVAGMPIKKEKGKAKQVYPVSIIRSAKGSLNIEDAWTWERLQILGWLHQLGLAPARYGVDKVHNAALQMVIGYIDYLVDNGWISDPTYFEELQRQSSATVELPDTKFEGVTLPVRTLYDGIAWILTITAVPNPAEEMFAAQNNYFMPLLALLGRWCRKLLPCTIMPVMVHIAYWTTPEKRHVTILGATPGGDQLLFSPTRTDDPYFDPSAEYRFRPPPGWVEERQARQKAAAKGKEPKKSKVDTPEPNGKDSAKKYWGFRGWVVVSDRQARLVDNGLEPPPGNALVNPDSGEQVARSNYGVCAESFFYIYISTLKAKAQAKEMPSKIRGFALKASDDIGAPPEGETKPVVKKVGFARKKKLNLRFISTRVQQPCQSSCQKIILDLNDGKKKGADRRIRFTLADMDPLNGSVTDPAVGEDEDEPEGIPDEDPSKPGSSSTKPKEDNKKKNRN